MAFNEGYQKALRKRVQQILSEEIMDKGIENPDYVSSFGNGSGGCMQCCPRCMGQGVVGGARAKAKPKNPKRVASGKKAAATNPWNAYVKKIMEESDIPLKDALKVASLTYQKKPKTKKPKLKKEKMAELKKILLSMCE